jgi:hypothetical protein
MWLIYSHKGDPRTHTKETHGSDMPVLDNGICLTRENFHASNESAERD